MTTPLFPTLIDSTILSTFKSCHRKVFWSFVLNRVPLGENGHLIAGGAYATAHEVFRKLFYSGRATKGTALREATKALIKAFGEYDPPPESRPSIAAKSWDRTLAAFLQYYLEFPPETDSVVPVLIEGEPATEFSFALPFHNLKNPQTGDPILYGGRLDGIVRFGGGPEATDWRDSSSPLFIYDDKTTYSMGFDWAKQWRLRSQFTGYVWGGRQDGYPLEGAILRGAAIQKTQSKFTQVIMHRQPWQVAEWEEVTYKTIQEMIKCWENEDWRKDLDGACASFGGCPYLDLCDTIHWEKWLDQYETRVWNPILMESL